VGQLVLRQVPTEHNGLLFGSPSAVCPQSDSMSFHVSVCSPDRVNLSVFLAEYSVMQERGIGEDVPNLTLQ
jgi:hypothetical protein